MSVDPFSVQATAQVYAACGGAGTLRRRRSASPPRPGGAELKHKLLAAIQSIKFTGSFAWGTALPLIDPQLRTDGIAGDIALPLSEANAQALISQARQAPYGKGGETVVDTAVRNTWELDATQFTFNNPRWDQSIERLSVLVAKQLGIQTPIRAEIYKMLIYEKGAMFKAHTDTEKIPGMFGTMVIALPSAHEGGDLVLRHGGETRTLKTSFKQPALAFWYSDVSHEVLPVTSGYRWVLTYNLAIDPQHQQPVTASTRPAVPPALGQTIQEWLAKDQAVRPCPTIYHVLDHQYTEAQSSTAMLKRRDREVVQALKTACSDKPVDVFLAHLEKEEMGSCQPLSDYAHGGYWGEEQEDEDDEDEEGFHPIEDLIERYFRVKTLFDLRGQKFMEDIKLDLNDILQADCFEDVEPEERFQGGYMGNEGCSATHWYRKTAAVLVPRDSIFAYFDTASVTAWGSKRPNPNANSIIEYVMQWAAREPSMVGLLSSVLTKVCKYVWDYETSERKPLLTVSNFCEVAKFAVVNRNMELFEEAAKYHLGSMKSDFFTWLRAWLVSSDAVEKQWANLSPGVMTSLFHYPHFSSMVRALDGLDPVSVRPQEEADDPLKCIRVYVRSQLVTLVNKYLSPDGQGQHPFTNADGQAMVDFSMYHEEPFKFLTETVAPRVRGKMDFSRFILGFLIQLDHYDSQNQLFAGKSRPIIHEIARQFILDTDFSKLRSPVQTPKGFEVPLRPPQSHQKNDMVSAEIGTFLSILQQAPGTDDLLELFLSKLAAVALQFQAQELTLLWMPFLLSAVRSSWHKKYPNTLELYQRLFVAVFKAYMTNYVGRRPSQERDLTRTAVRCTCHDCSDLNRFLVDRTKEEAGFKVAKSRRQHLHLQLDIAGVDCTHVTDRSRSRRGVGGNALTLVVTKTFRKLERETEEWEKRMGIAGRNIAQFDQTELKTILGTSYQTITGAARSRAALSQTSGNSAPRNDPGLLGQAAGEKRKRSTEETDIIDLTSDQVALVD